jgi:NADP-dependent 3-hydroxy acid dehydrogenase YdfG
MTSPRIAVVTGAGTGIGRAASVALAKSGFLVVLAGRRKEMLEATANAINAAGGTSLAARGGRIINNGSISAYSPRPLSAAYTATKHAVTGLTRQTALDGRAYDIPCGQIDIGNAATPLTDRMGQGAGVLQPSGQIMVEPRMDVDHAGSAVAYMASLPLDANVLFMTVMATKMPYVARG